VARRADAATQPDSSTEPSHRRLRAVPAEAGPLILPMHAGLLRHVVPPPVSVAETFADITTTGYHEEEALVRRAAEKRRREFLTVRHCGRAAMARLGVPPAPLLPATGGAPVWPDGVVGSMTHCDGYRAAAVARAEDVLALGVDAEPDQPLPPGVLEAVALPPELEWSEAAQRGGVGVCPDRLLFSAKEAVYKAWYPLTRRWLDFTDVLVTVSAPPAQVFTGRLLLRAGARAHGPSRFHGRWHVDAGLLVTAVTVPGPWTQVARAAA
jgi:4'-phosphopantetheinyl transferase EntD